MRRTRFLDLALLMTVMRFDDEAARNALAKNILYVVHVYHDDAEVGSASQNSIFLPESVASGNIISKSEE